MSCKQPVQAISIARPYFHWSNNLHTCTQTNTSGDLIVRPNPFESSLVHWQAPIFSAVAIHAHNHYTHNTHNCVFQVI